MRVFLDTNILVDVLMDRPGLADESAEVILRSARKKFAMFIAWHGLATAYYLLRRDRTEAAAMSDVDRILAWAEVANVGDADARRARELGLRDFEDALQVVSAGACAADCIVTRNVADFATGDVPAIRPEDFLRRFPDQ